MERATILVLGGYGKAGRNIARLLLAETGVGRVLVAGRNGDKAQDQARRLATAYGRSRVSALEVDASDTDALRLAFAAVDLVVVCLAYREDQAQAVLRAVLDSGIHYIDLTPDARKQTILKALADRLAARGCIVLTEAGIVPGCPSVLVRLAAGELDSVTEVTVASLYRDRQLAYDGAYDLLSHAQEQPYVVYENGRWQPVSALAARRVFFGRHFGRRLALPVYLNELQSLPGKLEIERLRLYQGSLNPVADSVLILWQWLRFMRSERMAGLFTRLLLWSVRRFTRPPFGIVQRLTAQGMKSGKPQQFTLALAQENMYLATAIPVVAAACQILDGAITDAGPQFMGCAVDAQQFLEEIERLGLDVSVNAPEEFVDSLQKRS